MKVFVTGATGYIGFHVASALRRAGHEVWGLARSEEKGRRLARAELHPVIGLMQKPEGWRAVAEQCSVIVHAAADYQADTLLLDRTTIEAILTWSDRGAQPKTVLYTSGAWVYGDTGGRLVDETTALKPCKLVERRPGTEQLVLNAKHARGIVIRPGCVYGKQGGLTGLWFRSAQAEKRVRAIGDGRQRWAMVHVDDLADAYVRAAESGVGGEAFNITDRSRATVDDMARAVARAAGCPDAIELMPLAQARAQMGDLADCLALDQHVDARKAVRRLGWTPIHGGFVDDVETYFAAWKAAQAS